ncbi:MAG: hypothetical protein M3Z18_01095 [Gemmatimonadota bacterium]|nr:hypothetical protein [Gemmatimonadota bacterium]
MIEVKKFALAKWLAASILQRFYNLDFRLLSSAFGFALAGCRNNNNPLALLARKTAAFA